MPLPGLTFHTSNRLENLAEQLVQSLRPPLADPFTPEYIVVQSGGMARWLTREIAGRTGIAMNLECPFPRAFVESILKKSFPEKMKRPEFAADALAWRIHRLLPTLEKKKAFAEVQRYLAAGDEMMRFQLAEKIAQTFDQYLVYRPEMLMEWERGDQREDWQAILWRALFTEGSPSRFTQVEALRDLKPPSGLMPERVSIFGVSSLPPFYFRAFFELSRHFEVRYFSLQPASEYFGHDLPPKQRAKLLARLAEKGATVSENDLPQGNPLLASLGRLPRDFIELRLDLDEQCGHLAQEAPEEFVEPGDADLLHALQSDLLHARNRGDGEFPKLGVGHDDRSIEIHACHSPMRELEVLYDQLLALLDEDSSLRPRDVLVLTPDIEKYAPFVQAVFDCPEVESRRIPFSIADRHPRSVSVTADAFLALLELAESRCGASEIFSLLERTPIRRRFAFTDDDLETIRGWIVESGVRWGIDGAHRAAFDLPSMEENSWRAGLDRLLLGYAMSAENGRFFEGILPCEGVEGTRAEVLGRFLTAVEAIFTLARQLVVPLALADWPGVLSGIIGNCFSGNDADEALELRAIRAAIERLRQLAEVAGDARPVELRLVRHQVTQLLDAGVGRGGFLSGRVTFCGLKPNRSIPARVVCLLGMNDLAFPRQARPLPFDKMTAHPRCGDQSVRDQDRAIFLETLLSVRERLFISFVGRSGRDNEPLPPSVLVSELLDYFERACTFPENQTARDFLVTEHRLHAFSAVYFSRNEARRFSFSEANAAAARALLRPPETEQGFVGDPLPEPDAGARIVELRSLAEFFVNPSKHFLRRRLGLTLDEADDTLDDLEPFGLGPLESYSIKQELLEHTLAGEPDSGDGFRARGLLPHGAVGASRFLTLRAEADEFAKQIASAIAGAARDEPLLAKLAIGDFSLAGKVESIFGGRLVLFRSAKLKAKDRIRAWVFHLALCAMRENERTTSLLFGTGKDDRVEYEPVENATAVLAQLLQLYWRGLTRPLPFFPASAFAFANAKSPEEAKRQSAAQAAWKGHRGFPGESEDRWFTLCFPNKNPLDGEFEELARVVFFPMLGLEIK